MKLSQKPSWMMRTLGVLLALAILLGSFTPATPAAAAACAFKHTVQAGDTLAYLGFLYNIDWQKIAEANKLQPPYLLIIGQVICIPQGASAPSTITGDPEKKGKEPTLTVVPTPNSVIVSVENFPKQRNYYVRVVHKLALSTYRIGRLRTNKEGKATDNFQLPDFLLTEPMMIVCVKDVLTDATLCAEYENPYYKVYRNFIYCIKNGR